MSFWEAQRAVDTAGLIDNMVEIGANLRERRQLEQEQKAFQAGYAKALEDAKRNGKMPDQYQRVVPIDKLGKHVGIKVVALRELAKYAPNHPLVTSSAVRENVGTQTVKHYCQANRPANPNYNDYAPDDEMTQRIYDFTLKP